MTAHEPGGGWGTAAFWVNQRLTFVPIHLPVPQFLLEKILVINTLLKLSNVDMSLLGAPPNYSFIQQIFVDSLSTKGCDELTPGPSPQEEYHLAETGRLITDYYTRLHEADAVVNVQTLRSAGARAVSERKLQDGLPWRKKAKCAQQGREGSMTSIVALSQSPAFSPAAEHLSLFKC